jgi:hypothetical protein
VRFKVPRTTDVKMAVSQAVRDYDDDRVNNTSRKVVDFYETTSVNILEDRRL